jgi:hypothetical protein
VLLLVLPLMGAWMSLAMRRSQLLTAAFSIFGDFLPVMGIFSLLLLMPTWHLSQSCICRALQAALVQAANRLLTHNPPSSASCFNQDALTGSRQSNLATGFTGAAAVMSYIADFGDFNVAVGHR